MQRNCIQSLTMLFTCAFDKPVSLKTLINQKKCVDYQKTKISFFEIGLAVLLGNLHISKPEVIGKKSCFSLRLFIIALHIILWRISVLVLDEEKKTLMSIWEHQAILQEHFSSNTKSLNDLSNTVEAT